ncbi:hypothetical protein H8D36_05780 [archaeon]|nr:hypothetical protein [archaeon]MBL7057057.1 hypothetical protein [Candidatus Woesearchaeota archaeon]
MAQNTSIFPVESRLIRATVSNGQLASLQKKGVEYMHNAAMPGVTPHDFEWSKSEIVMFPVVGPVDTDGDYHVSLGDERYQLDQHGISRALPFEVKEHNTTDNLVRLVQSYEGGSIPNPKSGGDNNPLKLNWVPYTLEKTLRVQDWGASVTFHLTNNSTKDMKYMFGWHPAFKIGGTKEKGKLTAVNGEEYSLMDVVDVKRTTGHSAIFVENANKIKYTNGRYGFEMIATGFKHFMLWCPDPFSSMFCIEPVTHLPVRDTQERNYLNGDYETLKPGKLAYFSVAIKML